MTRRNPSDPARNYAAWVELWRNVHPGLRWMIVYFFGVAVLVGINIGIVIGLAL